jgi:hypothetical protein
MIRFIAAHVLVIGTIAAIVKQLDITCSIACAIRAVSHNCVIGELEKRQARLSNNADQIN